MKRVSCDLRKHRRQAQQAAHKISDRDRLIDSIRKLIERKSIQLEQLLSTRNAVADAAAEARCVYQKSLGSYRKKIERKPRIVDATASFIVKDMDTILVDRNLSPIYFPGTILKIQPNSHGSSSPRTPCSLRFIVSGSDWVLKSAVIPIKLQFFEDEFARILGGKGDVVDLISEYSAFGKLYVAIGYSAYGAHLFPLRASFFFAIRQVREMALISAHPPHFVRLRRLVDSDEPAAMFYRFCCDHADRMEIAKWFQSQVEAKFVFQIKRSQMLGGSKRKMLDELNAVSGGRRQI